MMTLTTREPRRRDSCSLRLLAAVFATLVLASALVPAVGKAHTTPGVPHHTRPALDPVRLTYNAHCLYNFHHPTLHGYTTEYVYWQLMTAYFENNQWRYEYGDWARVWTSPTGMIYGFEARHPFSGAWEFSNGVSGIYVRRGPNRHIGYHIYYSSRAWESANAHHYEWLTPAGGITC